MNKKRADHRGPVVFSRFCLFHAAAKETRLRDKRRIGVYLERLLSKQLRMNRALEADEAVCLLEEWLSKETVNESKMSY